MLFRSITATLNCKNLLELNPIWLWGHECFQRRKLSAGLKSVNVLTTCKNGSRFDKPDLGQLQRECVVLKTELKKST